MKTKADFEPDINEQIGGTLFCPKFQGFHQSLDNKVANAKRLGIHEWEITLSFQTNGLTLGCLAG